MAEYVARRTCASVVSITKGTDVFGSIQAMRESGIAVVKLGFFTRLPEALGVDPSDRTRVYDAGIQELLAALGGQELAHRELIAQQVAPALGWAQAPVTAETGRNTPTVVGVARQNGI